MLYGLWIYSVDQGKSFRLSSDRYQDFTPAFSSCGEYIFFLSDRDFDINFQEGISTMEFDYVFSKTTRMYAMALTEDAPDLFKDADNLNNAENQDTGKQNSNNEKKKKGDDSGTDKQEAAPVAIDFDGITDRVDAFPLTAGRYNRVFDIGGKVLYAKDRELRVYDLKSHKDQLVIKGAELKALSADSKKLLYKAGKKWEIIGIAPKQKVSVGELKLNDMELKIDPEKEWQQIFNEGWLIFRDWFYASNMHGVDWQKLKKKYEVLLPYVSNRFDLDYIFSELVAELNVGHAYVSYGDLPKVKRMDTGLLGTELIADKKAGRHKIVKIYNGENLNERSRSTWTG